MHSIVFVPYYFRWHYTQGIKDLAHNLANFIYFLTDFFSLAPLFKTLFSPWERMGDSYKQGFHPKEALSSFLINSIMRVFGFFVRSAVLIVGFLSLVVSMVLCILIFLLWIFYPILIAFILALSIRFIFS